MVRNLYNVSLKITLFASILITAGCGDDNNPVDPDHGEEHAEAFGLIIRNSGEEKGERYIAPMYNQIIADGAAVSISQLAFEDVGMLGTPEQLEAFIASPPPSAAKWTIAK